MKGFFNRILKIDLNGRRFSEEEISDEIFQNFLGGKGLATHLLLKRNPKGVDPFSPDNLLIFAVGCATDAKVHGSSRYGVFTKSPLTGIYSESYAGGKVAQPLSRTGYDAVILEGSSDKPVYLEISPGTVKFHDASRLWGKGTYETEDSVLEATGIKGAAAVVIGPGGENLVRFSVIENDYWRSCGRTGSGAVMGSKKVKALVFHGDKKRTTAKPEVLDALWKKTAKRAKTDTAVAAYRKLGTPMMVKINNNAGCFPTKYWTRGTYDKWENISADTLIRDYGARPRACPLCFMACGKISEVKDGRHKGLKIEGPEYETIYAFGGLCMIDRLDEIIYLNDICDNSGIDTMTAGNLCGFVIEASRRGKIKERIDYGEVDKIAGLLKDIAVKRGLGAILAEGIRYAAREWGMEDVAVHVKGLEPAGYEPRTLKGMGLAYAISDRGACHLRATVYKPELSGIIDPDQIEGKAELLIDYEDRAILFDTMVLCRFFRDLFLWDELGQIVEGTTGMKLDKDGLQRIAANILSLTRKFNEREGVTRKDDNLPERFFTEPLEDSGKIIKKEDMEKMLDDYYELRGWKK